MAAKIAWCSTMDPRGIGQGRGPSMAAKRQNWRMHGGVGLVKAIKIVDFQRVFLQAEVAAQLTNPVIGDGLGDLFHSHQFQHLGQKGAFADLGQRKARHLGARCGTVRTRCSTAKRVTASKTGVRETPDCVQILGLRRISPGRKNIERLASRMLAYTLCASDPLKSSSGRKVFLGQLHLSHGHYGGLARGVWHTNMLAGAHHLSTTPSCPAPLPWHCRKVLCP